MCGIAGVVEAGSFRDPDDIAATVRVMADTMVARGPDGSGTWVDAEHGVGFSHRRLAVVDLSEQGHQPMASADGRFVITYNGEVYNADEVAAELRDAGVVFRGHSDTEVLVEAIARFGLRPTLDRIDGMWAFAVWDRRERRLTLVRDRLGEKPLVYGRLAGASFAFGSSLDALRAHPRFDRPIDRDALSLFFRFKYVPAPFTIFEGIAKLRPGHLVEVDSDGRVGVPEPYWSYFDALGPEPTFAGSPADAVEELDTLLRRSVRRRLVADVPVGAFLSGGIDSSTVVAAAQRESTGAVRTFTIGSTSADYDEAADARAVAGHLGTDHTELVVTEQDVLSMVDRLGAAYDEPFADSSQVPTLLVSQLARQQVTVALSGDGGDELFGGYNRYAWAPSIWRKIGRIPVPARRAVAPLLLGLPPSAWDRAARLLPRHRRPRLVGLKVAKVAGVLDAEAPEEVFHRLASHWQNPTELVVGSREPDVEHTDPAAWPLRRDLIEHMMAIDAVTYLPDDVLAKVDRATMAFSLEGRVPLLDRSIVEFAASLPTSMKLRDGTSKWVLREVLHRYVPRALMDRPKSGFGVPIESWLTGPLKGWAEELLFGPESRAFLDQAVLRRRWATHQSGRANQAYELWDVAMFANWARHRGVAG